MPWRRRPRAALFMLLGAGALAAAAAGLRTPAPPLPSPQASIDTTLTRDAAGCAGVNSTVWHPLSGLHYTGRLHLTLPIQFGGALSLYVGASIPLDIEASTEAGDPVQIHHERLIVGPGVFVPPDFWIEDGSPLAAPRHVSRLLIDASGEVPRTVLLSLGRRAPRVLARAIGYPPHVRLPVCADPIGVDEIYFAAGWYGQESVPGVGAIRWMREYGAVVVSSSDGGEARLRVNLAPAVEQGTRVTVRVNDVYDVAPLLLAEGFQEYELVVPDAAWVEGANELLFTVTRTQTIGSRVRGLALASLHVQ